MALKALADGLFAEVRGDHPSVLALHGWGRDRTDFDQVLDGIDSIAIDLPGHGASPPPPDAWGAEQYAAAIAPVVGGFDAPPVVLGHSFGGRVAVCLAASGQPIGGLVLVGVPLLKRPTARVRTSRGYRAVRWAHRLGLASDHRLEAAKRRYGSADYRASSGVMRDILVRAVNETYEDQLSAVRVPTHLVWGADDTAAGAWIVDAAAGILRRSGTEVSTVVLPGVGHDVHLQRPDAIRSALAALAER